MCTWPHTLHSPMACPAGTHIPRQKTEKKASVCQSDFSWCCPKTPRHVHKFVQSEKGGKSVHGWGPDPLRKEMEPNTRFSAAYSHCHACSARVALCLKMSARANSSQSYSSKSNKENTIDEVPWCSAPRHTDPILAEATPARVFRTKASPQHCQRALWPGTGRLHTLSSRGVEPTTCRAPRRENTGWQGACITHPDRGLVQFSCDVSSPLAPREKVSCST